MDKNVYHALMKTEVTAYLRDNREAFGLIVPADTRVYLGDLKGVIASDLRSGFVRYDSRQGSGRRLSFVLRQRAFAHIRQFGVACCVLRIAVRSIVALVLAEP